MNNLVELNGDIQKLDDKLQLSCPNSHGVISVKSVDCRIVATGIVLKVGATIDVEKYPPRDGKPDLSQYSELMTNEETSYACIGANPSLNIPGVLIDCSTGNVIGKCFQSFPCTSPKGSSNGI